MCCGDCLSDKVEPDVKFNDHADKLTAHYDICNPLSHHEGIVRKYESLIKKTQAQDGDNEEKIKEYQSKVEKLKLEAGTGPDAIIQDLSDYCAKQLGIRKQDQDEKKELNGSMSVDEEQMPAQAQHDDVEDVKSGQADEKVDASFNTDKVNDDLGPEQEPQAHNTTIQKDNQI